MRPVLEEEPAAVDEAIEARPLVGAEAAPHREIVRALHHVDRVHLETAHVLDEPGQAVGREAVGARTTQMLLGASSHAIPVTSGEPMFGQWQRLLLVELDEPKERQVLFHVFGD